MDQYIPKNIYQTAYEATYHMYLANIGGKVDDNTEEYITVERKYLETLKKKMDEALLSKIKSNE